MNRVSILRLELFKYSHESFLSALDAEGISHGPVHQFSSRAQASAFIESISALSDAMPWNSIAKVMIAWIDAKKSREIIITTKDRQVFHLKGYSITEAEKIIKLSQNATIIDTDPDVKTNKVLN